jgi:5-methylcytosine-specific restriction endonuclease McrA
MTPTKRPKRITKPSTAKEKKKTWTVFSKYIRLRDAMRTTGTLEDAKCVSCQRIYPVGKLQAGHFISRRHNNILFDERNVAAQCVGCNLKQKGNWAGYYEQMIKLYGTDVIEELLMLRQLPKHFTASELIEMREDYERRIKEM